MLFWEEVAAVERVAGDIRRELAPDLKRAAVVHVPGPKRSGPAPQYEHRASDPASFRAVGTVVLTVDARCGTVLLADRVEMVGILQLREVLRTRVIVECVRRRTPLATQCLVDHSLWRRADELFGER